jgi:hypothetical protein
VESVRRASYGGPPAPARPEGPAPTPHARRACRSGRPAAARSAAALTLNAGRVLVSLTLPERLRPEHVAFARSLAEQAAAYATEVERLYRNGHASGRAA